MLYGVVENIDFLNEDEIFIWLVTGEVIAADTRNEAIGYFGGQALEDRVIFNPNSVVSIREYHEHKDEVGWEFDHLWRV